MAPTHTEKTSKNARAPPKKTTKRAPTNATGKENRNVTTNTSDGPTGPPVKKQTLAERNKALEKELVEAKGDT